MKKLKIADGIHMLTMNVDDILFEGIWEIANGVTLNSYIVQGEKTAIIDGVIGWDGVPETLYKNMEEIGVDPKSIDYLIVNHMEPDHSGWISNFRKIKDDFTVICTEKAARMVKTFYDEDRVRIVKEGDTLDLGRGKVLSFHPVPNVHWPDTMYTYERDTKTLFSCDMFGAFGRMNEHCFDDELTPEEMDFFEFEGIRYYSNVMATFTPSLKKAIEKAKTLDIRIIAPGHGPVYRKNPQKIMNDYYRFSQYAEGAGKNEVTILWGSMYGMTKKAVDFAERVLQREKVKYNKLEMPQESESAMIAAVFESAGVIIAAPTYEYKLFPPVAAALNEIGRKRITGKTAFRFGSYGWSGGAEKELKEIMERNNMKWDFIESVEFEGAPREEDLKRIETGILELLKKMKEKVVE
ncbi:anaerobic nitric oxide reductase flavorubredoxin NorV [Thermoclostridium stercorarium subsp. stercorarium DSM 8532]|jgi:anaerobic nitric oxide reductase flavorubredoxin|uniref:Anaerobic nitric oxide reductase flavorubredoxin NorV n=3 Tax=Thermoclostridium stercorarium TaxID=1510 RepID=L7VTC7_THES1|nr:FprA family A-type flavoprotein [Thermoclostridium stercorarium]AGC68823.1 anaerobic nitric oxide reductase flavorubredoxin NorV [Thermoclostridium stercorarium subsp. stercorarium DSM 8532]AGI39822.1 flavoprotein [Thermoclostridium stercorarium subsp. stercorarium DSM 8532]ANW99131.1 MBL fold metallo-hydrolase [Thermoclostridium stercorarium subsp. thermolacticum DSM 2910]ANX01695.1 MBL fold metallo-hydrolase [Thermoclostridium stercorarium subsp. leptospartum DSM 9219]